MVSVNCMTRERAATISIENHRDDELCNYYLGSIGDVASKPFSNIDGSDNANDCSGVKPRRDTSLTYIKIKAGRV